MSKIICSACSRIVLEKFGAYECISGINFGESCDLCGEDMEHKERDCVREDTFNRIIKKIKTKTITVKESWECPFCTECNGNDICGLHDDYCCGTKSLTCPLNQHKEILIVLKDSENESNHD